MILCFLGERGSLTDLLSAGITNEMIEWLGPLIEFLQLPESKIIQCLVRIANIDTYTCYTDILK